MSENEIKYRCSLAGRGFCKWEWWGGECTCGYNCTNKERVVKAPVKQAPSDLIEKYKTKLYAHMNYGMDRGNFSGNVETVLYDMQTDLLKEIIKDLENAKK